MSLVVAFNRAPITVSRVGLSWQATKAQTSVASAISSVLQRRGGIWLGWPGTFREDQVDFGPVQSYDSSYAVKYIIPERGTFDQYSRIFCNSVLWPHFHSLSNNACNASAEAFRAYESINTMFAGRLCELSNSDDIVWIHDYHLLLAPSHMRALGSNLRIGLFLHIPFPPHNVAIRIPYISNILKGMLGANVIGFQTKADGRNFASIVEKILGISVCGCSCEHSHQAKGIRTFVAPIGIDKAKLIQPVPDHSAIREWLKFPCRIISAERADYIKGISEKINGLKLFLARHPEYKNNLVLLQFLERSRGGIDAYDKELEKIEASINNINREHSTYEWKPVQVIWDEKPDVVWSTYQHATVALVNSFRDGMNLVSKEYALAGPKDGALILSTFTGSWDQLGQWSTPVNPHDEESIVNAFYTVLSMSEPEKIRRKSMLRENVSREDVFWWAERNLSAIESS